MLFADKAICLALVLTATGLGVYAAPAGEVALPAGQTRVAGLASADEPATQPGRHCEVLCVESGLCDVLLVTPAPLPAETRIERAMATTPASRAIGAEMSELPVALHLRV